MRRFAVIADSHFHPQGQPAQAAYASDAEFNARNAAAVALLSRAQPDLVVHLGDVVHPIPGLPEHEAAIEVARRTYREISVPLLVAPGNHDVGDKRHPWAPAPSVNDEKHSTFRRFWGAPWWVEQRGEIRLVGIDSPVLNSGLPLEEEQWEWLQTELAPAESGEKRRIFVFLHYPPFLLDPNEPEHYDNIAEPARGRLLALFARAGVEAVFAGHVHHPFWNRHQGIDYYLLPSTAFVRPGYAELARVSPGDEYGRNDVQRLGFCIVHLSETGHRVEWVRTEGTTDPDRVMGAVSPLAEQPRCPVGLTLRHAWDAVHDIAADGLDPFRRKYARNDLVLLASQELGADLWRLPIDDLRNSAARTRLLALWQSRKQRAVFFTADPLTEADRELIAESAPWILAIELVRPRMALDQELPELPVARWVAPYGRQPAQSGRYFSHFAPYGFTLRDPDVARARCDGLLYRLEPGEDPSEAIPAMAEEASARGASAAVLALLPRSGEGACFDDDEAISALVISVARAARENPGVFVFLDTLVDQDRGYFPRHGLLDRRGNPRSAFRTLSRLCRGE